MKRLLHFAAWSGMVLVAVIVVLKFGPTFESTAFPVFRDQSLKYLNIDGEGNIDFIMSAQKVRDCHTVAIAWSMTSGDRRVSVAVTNAAGNPIVGTVSSPVGPLNMGPWHAELPLSFYLNTSYLMGIFYYRCHTGWVQEQLVGPIKIVPPWISPPR